MTIFFTFPKTNPHSAYLKGEFEVVGVPESGVREYVEALIILGMDVRVSL